MIKKAEFGRRRRKLMNFMGNNSIAILPSSSEIVRSRDTDFRFRQHSDFHYLSAFPEPEAVLVLLPGREQGEYIIFCRELPGFCISLFLFPLFPLTKQTHF